MSLPTMTQTKTFTITNTKLLVATAALAAACSLAFIVAPLAGFTSSVVNSPQDTTKTASIPTSPRPSLTVPKNTDANPSVVCADTDGGKIPAVAGTVSLFNPKGLFIVSTDTDSCVDDDTVKEYFCDSPPNTDPQSYTFEKIPCGLGNKCLAGECKLAPRLTVGIDKDTPEANNHVMGAVGVTIAKLFIATSSSPENVNVSQIVTSFAVSPGAEVFLKNIRLIDNDSGKQVGPTVPAPSAMVNGKNAQFKNYTHAAFSGFNLVIPKGLTKTLFVMADFETYGNSGATTTGQTFTPALLTTFSGNAADVSAVGVGSTSGLPAFTVVSANHQDGARAKEITLYRAKLIAAWANDTPSGPSAPSAAQRVAKFVLTNFANSGTYPATIQTINLSLLDSNITATATRTLYIYKDSPATTELGSFNYLAGQRFFGNSAINDANFTDVEISSGSSKTFYATMDTTDFYANSAFSVSVEDTGVVWSDGITKNITLMGRTLPFNFKTFTY